MRHGNRRSPEWIDYFVFPRGLYAADLPPLVIGRPFWDNWLVWKTLDLKQPVVDVSPVVLAVHQNHDYRHHPQGLAGVLHGEEANWNHRLAGGWKHLRTIADATEVLYPDGLRPNTKRHWAAVKRYTRQGGRVLLCDVWQPICFFLAGITRPLRRRGQSAGQDTQAFPQ